MKIPVVGGCQPFIVSIYSLLPLVADNGDGMVSTAPVMREAVTRAWVQGGGLRGPKRYVEGRSQPVGLMNRLVTTTSAHSDWRRTILPARAAALLVALSGRALSAGEKLFGVGG